MSGQTVTFTATVTANSPGSGSPGGTVAFKYGAATITGCGAQTLNVGGQATCLASYNASGGNRSITAVYAVSSDYATSTSAALTQTVSKAATSTVVTSSANPSVTGQSVTFTATVSATSPGSGTPTGTVNFTDASLTISGCGAKTLSGGIAACTTSYNASGGNRTQISAVEDVPFVVELRDGGPLVVVRR